MHKAIQHKHIIIRAECNDPPMNPNEAVAWWEKLVRDYSERAYLCLNTFFYKIFSNLLFYRCLL